MEKLVGSCRRKNVEAGVLWHGEMAGKGSGKTRKAYEQKQFFLS